MLGRIGGLVSAAVILLGSLLPWWSVSSIGSESAGGFEYGNDGPVALLAALAIGALLWFWNRTTIVAATALSGTVVVIALHALATNSSRFGDLGGMADIKPGAGLILVTLGALAALGLSIFGLVTGGKGDGAAFKQVFGQALAQPTTPGYSLPPQGQAPAQGYGQAPAQQYGQAPAQPYGQAASPSYPQQAEPAAPAVAQPVEQPVAAPEPAPVAEQPVAAAEQPAAAVPAGWYPDPHGKAPLRYWDGTTWTEHVHGGN